MVGVSAEGALEFGHVLGDRKSSANVKKLAKLQQPFGLLTMKWLKTTAQGFSPAKLAITSLALIRHHFVMPMLKNTHARVANAERAIN